jgi:hypothetical protein
VKVLALRRPDACASCGTPIAVGERASWDSVTKTVTCLSCLAPLPAAWSSPEQAETRVTPPALDRGTPGRSVTREAQRRSERHRKLQEDRVAADQAWRVQVKTEQPVLGRLRAAVTPKVRVQPAPQHVRAWVAGAPGEQKVGEVLEGVPGIIVLHDRRKPRSRSNIDHIAVTPAAVWVIDTKVRAGKKLEFRDKGGFLSRDERLIVGGRDETRLVDDMAWQVQAVHDVCADLLGDAVVRGALCFVDATIGLFDRRPWMVKGVVVCWRAVLADLLLRPGPLDERRITEIAGRIATQLPPA